MKFAIFEWVDAQATAGWEEFANFLPKKSEFAGGFLVHETEDWVVMAATIDVENEQANAVISIPRGMIKTPMIFYGDLEKLIDILAKK